MFYCDKCGLCCRSIGSNELYAFLDRGDGICMYYDENSRLCSIYWMRPDICNVDRMYEMNFSSVMTLEEYYRINYEACNSLKRKQNNN